MTSLPILKPNRTLSGRLQPTGNLLLLAPVPSKLENLDKAWDGIWSGLEEAQKVVQ